MEEFDGGPAVGVETDELISFPQPVILVEVLLEFSSDDFISSFSLPFTMVDGSGLSKDASFNVAGNRSARIGFVLEREELLVFLSPISTDSSFFIVSLVLSELRFSISGLQLLLLFGHSEGEILDVLTLDKASWSVVESAATEFERVLEGVSFPGKHDVEVIC